MSAAEKKLEEVIYQAVAATFENLAFMSINRRANEIPADVDPAVWLWAKVDFTGSITGQFALVCVRRFMENMFASLYGRSTDGDRGEKLVEVLKESVNTAAGHCLRSLVPKDTIFNLSVPCGGAGWPKLEANYVYRFSTEDGKPILALVNLPFLGLQL